MSLVDDETTLERRQSEALRAALRLDLMPKGLPARSAQVPYNLCQYAAQKERHYARQVCHKLIRSRRLKGGALNLVTIARPEWTVLADGLTPGLVHEVREWTSRRARNLTRFGRYRAIGFVDIAWNERSAVSETSHWSVHAHILVLVQFVEDYDTHQVLRHVFGCEEDGDRVSMAIDVQLAHTPPTAMDYCSRALLMNLPRQRWSYLTDKGRNTWDQFLPRALQREFEALVAKMGPKPFWILSGIRRYGDNFIPMNSKVEPRLYARFLAKRQPATLPAARDKTKPTAPSRRGAFLARPHGDRPAPHRSR